MNTSLTTALNKPSVRLVVDQLKDLGLSDAEALSFIVESAEPFQQLVAARSGFGMMSSTSAEDMEAERLRIVNALLERNSKLQDAIDVAIDGMTLTISAPAVGGSGVRVGVRVPSDVFAELTALAE